MNGYTVRKISDLAAEYGEDLVKRIVSSFPCRYNDEVDEFLVSSALDFARRRISITDIFCAGAVRPTVCAGKRRKR